MNIFFLCICTCVYFGSCCTLTLGSFYTCLYKWGLRFVLAWARNNGLWLYHYSYEPSLLIWCFLQVSTIFFFFFLFVRVSVKVFLTLSVKFRLLVKTQIPLYIFYILTLMIYNNIDEDITWVFVIGCSCRCIICKDEERWPVPSLFAGTHESSQSHGLYVCSATAYQRATRCPGRDEEGSVSGSH